MLQTPKNAIRVTKKYPTIFLKFSVVKMLSLSMDTINKMKR